MAAKSSKHKSNLGNEIVDKVKLNSGELPIKQFAPRNPLLEDLFENPHIKTVYHLFICIFISLCLTTIISDYLYEGQIRLGLTLIIAGFAKIHIAILIWICAFFSTLLVYFCFKYWAVMRISLKPQSVWLKLWDKLALTFLFCYYLGLAYFVTLGAVQNDLAIAETMAILMEGTRFLMKVHAFVRTNVPRVLKYKVHDEKQILHPTIGQFLYFSFAPTLVYRDSYPRSRGSIRWNYVFKSFLEVWLGIFFYSFLIERSFMKDFKDFGLRNYTWQEIIVKTFSNAGYGLFCLLLIFYITLHAWSNAFAEMLRFSDRLFFKDWWISATHERYYRTWNVVVHDWLYTYIYKDFYEIIIPSKPLAKMMVFFASALFHDLILGFAFRFYSPILFIEFFIFGQLITYIKIKHFLIGNVMLWYTTALGASISVTIYTLEYYARVNCPIEEKTFSSYFIPRMLDCVP